MEISSSLRGSEWFSTQCRPRYQEVTYNSFPARPLLLMLCKERKHERNPREHFWVGRGITTVCVPKERAAWGAWPWTRTAVFSWLLTAEQNHVIIKNRGLSGSLGCAGTLRALYHLNSVLMNLLSIAVWLLNILFCFCTPCNMTKILKCYPEMFQMGRSFLNLVLMWLRWVRWARTILSSRSSSELWIQGHKADKLFWILLNQCKWEDSHGTSFLCFLRYFHINPTWTKPRLLLPDVHLYSRKRNSRWMMSFIVNFLRFWKIQMA